MSFPFLCSGIASCSAVCPGSVVRVHVPATTTFPCVGSSETLPSARSVSFLCRPAALGLCILQSHTFHFEGESLRHAALWRSEDVFVCACGADVDAASRCRRPLRTLLDTHAFVSYIM